MPMCWSSEQVISNRAKQLIEFYKDKHLPGCVSCSTPLKESDCICSGPEKEFLLESWALDYATNEYHESIERITKSIVS